MPNIIDKIQLSGVTYDIGGQGSGVSVVEVTQAEYDALPSSAKTDTSKMYVITDAEAGDLTNYYTKTQTNTLLGGKQATLVSGTNIKTINNESLLGSGNIDIQGGGGKAVSGGTNISVVTGETADTINCTLPITAETSSTKCLIKIGANLNVSNGSNYEWAIGRYNITRTKASGSWANSGNTAFSIGIGTPWNSYNGLEVRQNGDVYIADTRTGSFPYQYKMIKLQDAVAATAANTTALGGLKLVKLTQAEYDALVTKDSNTLYVIVN